MLITSCPCRVCGHDLTSVPGKLHAEYIEDACGRWLRGHYYLVPYTTSPLCRPCREQLALQHLIVRE